MKVKKTKIVEELIKEDDEIKAGAGEAAEGEGIATATPAEIAADMAQAAAEEGKEVADQEKLMDEAEAVYQLADMIINPYGTSKPGKIERSLQRSLEVTLRNRRAGIKGDFQNVIVSGLAGFGKTAIIKKFCKDHHLNIFECDAKSLDIATVGGIPYPKKDKKTGEVTQAPINSSYWNGLKDDNVILFLDELNRTSGRIRGSLLTLINEHQLPGTVEDPETGRQIKNVLKFPNILFTVIAINPADDVFQDNEDLDPAMVSRNPVIITQDPDIKEFMSHIKTVYDAIAACPNLSPEDQAVYAGQHEIAKALLTDRGFAFDDADDVRQIYLTKGKAPGNYLNYRTFLALLMRSNGKKDDYIWVIQNESNLSAAKRTMIKNILATYTDKVTTGNKIFNQQVNPGRQAAAAADVASALDDFVNTYLDAGDISEDLEIREDLR